MMSTEDLRNARALVEQMTLEEKASLCSGADAWTTTAIERLGIPSIAVADGPHGVRKATGLDVTHSLPATCFPTASALASTWNETLVHEVGHALGLEAQALDVQVLLGPGVNMKRSVLGGRNFEYFSEDPALAGAIAAALIRGVQSQGVGCSIKHFAANNQEFERMASDSVVDEQTLFEIYLRAFEIAIASADPATIMCAYNKLNGVYASEHPQLLTDILKERFGSRGIVISDWGAVDDRVAGVRAGLHLEMPGNGGINDRKIVHAVRAGELDESVLDERVASLVAVVSMLHAKRRPNATFDTAEHDALARRVAAEAIVLLKNEGGALPIDPLDASKNEIKIAVLGAFAGAPRFQGAGSSQVNPTRVTTPLQALHEQLGGRATLVDAPGYADDGSSDPGLCNEAVALASEADVAIVFAGLPDSFESEGFDREHIDLPRGHLELIDAVAQVQSTTIVVLMNGAAVAMPFASHPNVKAIVEAWLGGQAGGGAIADVLTGRVNPSGKLSETFPRRLEDTPTALEFPGREGVARYGEGLFIGYRYFDKKGIDPLFPFGYGLSYTTFAYESLTLGSSSIRASQGVSLEVRVRNAGAVPGQEVVQVYVRRAHDLRGRPDKELKHFAKVRLEPQEAKTLRFTLSRRDFAVVGRTTGAWEVSSGDYEILVGSSSRDLPLQRTVAVVDDEGSHPPLTRRSMIKAFKDHPRGHAVYRKILETVTREFGAAGREDTEQDRAARAKSARMMEAVVRDLPIYRLATLFGHDFSEAQVEALLQEAGIEGTAV